MTRKEKRSKINEIVEHEEGIAMASQVLNKISRDQEERIRIMQADKAELDYQSEISYYRNLGLEEGRKEGREQGLEQGLEQGHRMGRDEGLEIVVKNALALGLPLDTIHKITGQDIALIEEIAAKLGN